MSTATNLCNFNNYISNVLDNHLQIDIVYTDFSKAFDQVVHGVLLNKLHNFRFSEPLIKLCKSFLIGRMNYIEYLSGVYTYNMKSLLWDLLIELKVFKENSWYSFTSENMEIMPLWVTPMSSYWRNLVSLL